MTGRPTVEVGVIGNEGVVGVDIFMGAPTQLNDAIVQGEGSAWRMTAERRQEIAVIDRDGLERMACECYAIVRRVYEQAITN